jgi:hypothetical protein
VTLSSISVIFKKEKQSGKERKGLLVLINDWIWCLTESKTKWRLRSTSERKVEFCLFDRVHCLVLEGEFLFDIWDRVSFQFQFFQIQHRYVEILEFVLMFLRVSSVLQRQTLSNWVLYSNEFQTNKQTNKVKRCHFFHC